MFDILPEAESEGLRAAGWYDAANPGKGNDFLDELYLSYRSIQQMPSSFPPLTPRRLTGDFRFHAMDRFQYIIYFRVKNGDILIVAISHYRRQPFYWTGRLKHR